VSPALDLSCIVVGYFPAPVGTAAYEQAQEWARASSARLVVVNTGRNGNDSHPSAAIAHEADLVVLGAFVAGHRWAS